MKLIKRLYLSITAVGLVFVYQPFTMASSSAEWYLGDWNCSIDGRPAKMRWKAESVNRSCGDNCTEAGSVTKGKFSDNGQPPVSLEAVGKGSSFVSFRYGQDKENLWQLRYDNSTGIASGNTIWEGKAYPLQCVLSPKSPPGLESKAPSIPVPPPVIQTPVEKPPEPSRPLPPKVVKPPIVPKDVVEGTPSTFTAWCKRRSNFSAATQLTIDVLLEKAGTDDCQQANSKLRNLRKLDLSDNKISDLQPLSVFTNLAAIDLSRNKISDLQPLANLKNLNSLSLDTNQIRSLNSLRTINSLAYLNLSNNQVRSIEPLKSLQLLTVLYIAGNKISDLKSFSNDVNFRDLGSLDLSYNQIEDLNPLAVGAKKLVILNLSNNRIVNVKPLTSLTELRTLSLGNNQIGDLQPLLTLINLKYLTLANNQISDLQPLSSLINLKQIGISNTEKSLMESCPRKPKPICHYITYQ